MTTRKRKIAKKSSNKSKVRRQSKRATRRNPLDVDPTWDYDYNAKVDTGPLGLQDPVGSFQLGRLVGLKRGLDLCKISTYFKRKKIKEKIQRDMDRWLDSLALQAESVARGVQGAKLPKLMQGEGGMPKKSK